VNRVFWAVYGAPNLGKEWRGNAPKSLTNLPDACELHREAFRKGRNRLS